MAPYTKRALKLLGTLFLVALPFVLFQQRWNIYDAYRLQGYTPPAKVVSLADETSMSAPARKLFYVYRPSLETKESFRQHCTSAEKSIVLGCYISFRGIYLQDISDERLAGIMQVTSAHEVLHAAYDRLDSSEKKRINVLLNARFEQLPNDHRIKQTVEEYKKTGADINNELHSILPSEIRDLGPELEAYYSRYFIDRTKIVAFSERYEAAFTSRKQQVAEYDKQLAALKVEIDAGNASLKAQQNDIENRQAELERLERTNRIDEYNAAVPGFNARVSAYNAQVARVRTLIDRYNEVVKLRNDIALEEGELVKAIDSRPSTVESQ